MRSREGGRPAAYRAAARSWLFFLDATAASTSDNRWIGGGIELRRDRDRWNRRAGWAPALSLAVNDGVTYGSRGLNVAVAPILREEGYPEIVIEGVLSHAEHLAMPRDTPMKKTLFACDELSGFVHACSLVRPEGIATLEPKSVIKKLKQPSFASGVHRDDVYKGAELLGVDLNEHIAFVTEAMRPIARELGLRTGEAAA